MITIPRAVFAIPLVLFLAWLLFLAPDRAVAPFADAYLRVASAVRSRWRRAMVWLADKALSRYMEPDHFIGLLKRDHWRHALISCMTLEDRLGLARNLLRGYFVAAHVEAAVAAATGQRNVAHNLNLRGKTEEAAAWREGAQWGYKLVRQLIPLLSDAEYAKVTQRIDVGLVAEHAQKPGLIETVRS